MIGWNREIEPSGEISISLLSLYGHTHDLKMGLAQQIRCAKEGAGGECALE
jgi:hypothetical protein